MPCTGHAVREGRDPVRALLQAGGQIKILAPRDQLADLPDHGRDDDEQENCHEGDKNSEDHPDGSLAGKFLFLHQPPDHRFEQVGDDPSDRQGDQDNDKLVSPIRVR